MAWEGGTSTVYILGAGVNKAIRSRYPGASPPLIRDFFQVAGQMDWWLGQGPHTQGQRFRRKYRRVYEYIMRY